MTEFGRYRLTYEPPAHGDLIEADISMSISSESTVETMLEFFECFLKAAGYQLDGEKLELAKEGTGVDESSWEDWLGPNPPITQTKPWVLCDR
jgi:hypothetical protein